MGPLLEPLGAASQGSGSCFSRNSTRGVERLLELELYSPKEREGLKSGTGAYSNLALDYHSGL